MNAATDPIALLNSLSADNLQARLDALNAEADALRVLLRSARARERQRAIRAARPMATAGHKPATAHDAEGRGADAS